MAPFKINWQCLVALNEEPNVAIKLRQSSWDFQRVAAILEDTKTKSPGRDIFVVAGPPIMLPSKELCPTICILKVPKGQEPPTYVLRKNPADHQDDSVIPFKDLGLAWRPYGNRQLGEGVFALKANKPNQDLSAYKLWTISSKDMKRKDNGDLDIKIANYCYQYNDNDGNAAVLEEVYSKDFSEISGILAMNELDDSEHYNDLRAAIGEGFAAARRKMEDRIDMLREKFPSHCDYDMVKIFPLNTFDEATCNSGRLAYFNEFYGKASETYKNYRINWSAIHHDRNV